jgi:hypothetical protein
MNWLYLAIIIVVVGLILYEFIPRDKLAQRTAKITHKIAGTPSIWLEDNVPDVTPAQMYAITSGLHTTIANGICAGYPKFDISKVVIAILNADVYDSAMAPALKVPVGKYRGSIYDQGGFMLISGRAIDPAKGIIIIPYHTDAQVSHLEQIVSFECEHLVLFESDKPRYEASKFHTEANPHPLLKGCA